MFRRSLVQLPAALLRRSAPTAACRAAAPLFLLRAIPALSRGMSTAAAAPSAPSAADSASHSDFAPQYKQSVSSSLEEAKQAIEKDIATHNVFVYMKGSPDSPKCGFSANVCRILNAYPGVKYGSRDVLEDEFVRQAIKQFSYEQHKLQHTPPSARARSLARMHSWCRVDWIGDPPARTLTDCSLVRPLLFFLVVSDWPTLPQVFVKGEFVGGSDIVGNMYKSGELDKLLGATPATPKAQ